MQIGVMASTEPLPSAAPFPEAGWRERLVPEEWEACLDAWIALAAAHLVLSNTEFARISAKDQSLSDFVLSYAAEMAWSDAPATLRDWAKSKSFRKLCFLLSHRLLAIENPPETLLCWNFLADMSKVYGREHGKTLVQLVWRNHRTFLESSMSIFKGLLIKNLDVGIKGDLKKVESLLKRLNYLLHSSSEAAAFFVAGSEFLDSLVSCYKIMNPPLRKAIISTIYLCLIGLTKGDKPNFSSLIDHLYALKTAAETHKAGPFNANDSAVAQLITVTPILKQIQKQIDANGSGSSRAKSVLSSLEVFQKAVRDTKPCRLSQNKIDKGKKRGKNVTNSDRRADGQVHIRQMSLISQIQDLFPDLSSGFVARLLDEYNNNIEVVISHLLEGTLPSHIGKADRTDSSNFANEFTAYPESTSQPVYPELPARHNIFDGDAFDQLAIDTSKIHFGSHNHDETVDANLLQDGSNAAYKAAIISALATFNLDDDERDDTYDIGDVGGTIDSTASFEDASSTSPDAHDDALFRVFKIDPDIFDRDAMTRRGNSRRALREELGLTDEAIEGWAVMLSRDPKRLKRLEAKFGVFSGAQRTLVPTAWSAGSEAEDADEGENGIRFRNGRGRGGLRGRTVRGTTRPRGDVAGQTSSRDTEAVRRKKEANKGSRANHDRRKQRANKMARGSFPG